MNDKSTLLEQLRIDRTPSETSGHGGRRGLIGLGIVLLLLAAIGAWIVVSARDRIPVHAATAKALPTTGNTVTGGSLLDASGYVVALRQASVSAKAIYKVNEMLVQEGETVKKDQIIARLDDSNVHAALDQSKAQLQQLEAALEQAKVAAADQGPLYLRDQKQLAEGLISPETFDTTKAGYDAAQTAVVVAERNVAVANATVELNQSYEDDTVIRAPFDGVVTVKNAQPGQIVSPQFSGGGGIVNLVDMNSLEVDVDVSENFINRVHADQPATITLNAYPDWQIPAAVIAIIPTADQTKATVKVRVRFKQKDARILPEMGARVSFLDDIAQSRAAGGASVPGVVVPFEAIQGDGASAVVWVIDGDTVTRHSVRLGARGTEGQTILSGVDPGSLVVIGDPAKLTEGAHVRVLQ